MTDWEVSVRGGGLESPYRDKKRDMDADQAAFEAMVDAATRPGSDRNGFLIFLVGRHRGGTIEQATYRVENGRPVRDGESREIPDAKLVKQREARARRKRRQP